MHKAKNMSFRGNVVMYFKRFLLFFFVITSSLVVADSNLPNPAGFPGYYYGKLLSPLFLEVGEDSVFVFVGVYDIVFTPNMSSLPVRYWKPDYAYLFYVNSSGAYLVYRAMLPYNFPPAQVFPIVSYYNNSWYLLLDHSAVTFNISPRRAIGLYRFNKNCLFPTTLLLYNVTSMADSRAIPTDYGNYIEFAPTQKSSMGFYFMVPKSVLDRYLGPNTTANTVVAYSFPGGETAVILPVEGALMENSENPRYIFVKPIACGLKCNYSVVADSTSENNFPYYGVLFYSKNGSIRFVPLIRYDLNSPKGVSLAPNVKPFNISFCPKSRGNTTTIGQNIHVRPFSAPLYWYILAFSLGVLSGVLIRRK